MRNLSGCSLIAAATLSQVLLPEMPLEPHDKDSGRIFILAGEGKINHYEIHPHSSQ
jgi:hypothetical protein